MSDWKTIEVGKLFEFIPTGSHSRESMSNHYSDDAVFNIHYGDIHTKYKNYVDFNTITPPQLKSPDSVKASMYLKDGDIVLVDASEDYAGVGTAIEIINLGSKKCIAGLHTFALRGRNDMIYPGYGSLIFQHPAVHMSMKKVSTYSKVFGISKSNLEKIIITLPPIEHQMRVVSIIKTWDQYVEGIQNKIDAKKKLQNSLLQKLFPRSIDGNPEYRLKQEDGSSYPDWQVRHLGEIADVRDGTHDTPEYVSVGKPLVTSKNLKSNGSLELNNVSNISLKDFEAINKRSGVGVGDILFGMIGTIGNPVRVQSNDFAIKNVALIKEKGAALNGYLVWYLRTKLIEQQFHRLNTGNTQKFIALGEIRKIKVALPALGEQHQIEKILSHAENEINTLEQVKSLAIEQRHYILKELMKNNNRTHNISLLSVNEVQHA